MSAKIVNDVHDVSEVKVVSDEQSTPAAAQTTTPTTTASDEQLEMGFLALMSHELRSPLTVIKGYAATLRRQGHRLGRAEREAFLHEIDMASDHLDRLIARLLELAQLEASAVTPSLAPVDMPHIIREALIAAEQRWGVKHNGASGHTFMPPEQHTAPLALADRRLLRDALDIVLENAVKYSPAGSDISVTLDVEDERIVVRVHDHGIGIAPDRLHRIFERFYRVDSRVTREHGGAGVGLSICKRVMALQGGEIWAESQLGVGSVFALALPLAQPAP